jgi:hypothetical protein
MPNSLPFTVISYDVETEQIFSDHVMATSFENAFIVCASDDERADANFVCVLNGHLNEGQHVSFAGVATASANDILETTSS